MFEIPKLLANIALLAVETAVMLAAGLFRFQLRIALTLTAFVGLCVATSFRTATGIVFYTAVGLLAWWLLGRLAARLWGELRVSAAYQALVGRWLYSMLRRWWLYERRWQRVLQGQHLTRVKPDGYDEVPKLGKVRCTRSGDYVRVKVLPGQTPLDFTGLDGQTSRNLAKGFKAAACRAEDIPQTDYITLDLPRGKDPLADTVPFPGIPTSTADVDLRRIPIGVDEHGRTVTVPIHGSHVLVAGQTGAGKGGIFWSIILHLIPFILEGSVVLTAIDPKRGVELNPGRNIFKGGFADTEEDIPVLLAKMVTVMDDNSDYIKSRRERKLTPTPERPLHVVFIDEYGRLASDKDCKESVRTLVNVGRAPGVSVVTAAQNATKEVVADRDEMPAKVALRLENVDSVRKLLGRAAYLAGARCEEIPRSLPGVGFLKVDELADELEDHVVPRWRSWLPWVSPADASTAMAPRRFRGYLIDDALIEETNERFASAGDETPVAV